MNYLNRSKSHRLRELLAEKDSKIIQLEAEQARLKNENERLNSTPARVVEWQRQEVVATTGAVLDILEELSSKVGVVYGNVSAIQGVFSNKASLNLSAQSKRENRNRAA